MRGAVKRAPDRDMGGSARSRPGKLRVRLYVAGEAPNSRAALANLRALLLRYGPEDYDLDIVDCLREPLRVLRDGILVTPTLQRVAPGPVQTIVGNLSDTAAVVRALGLPVLGVVDAASDE